MRRRSINFGRRLRWQSWLVMIGFGLALYFGYHAVNGSRGLLASQQLSSELRLAERKLAKFEKERMHLERRVKRLRSNSLDPDLIDELARETLSLTEPDDMIIILDTDQSSKIEHR